MAETKASCVVFSCMQGHISVQVQESVKCGVIELSPLEPRLPTIPPPN